MTAVFLPLLLLVGGFAVDYGYSSYLNQRLAQATDNAVLASVSQSAATAGGGFANTPWLETYGTNVFNNNIADLPISNVKFNLKVTPNGSLGVDSVGSYSYSFPTYFAGVVGIPTIPLKSQIKASANPVTYIDYYIIVDISQSMGIGSTKADMDALWSKGLKEGAGAFGEPSCVFACHVLHSTQDGPKTNEQIAHSGSPQVTLRIDAAVAAIQNIISVAQSNAGINKNIRIGLYTLDHNYDNPSQYYTVIQKPTADYATLIKQAAAIDLQDDKPSFGDTEFSTALANFSKAVLPAVNGSGASSVSPQNYVFLISDGLADSGDLNPCVTSGVNTCTKPIVAGDCSPLKPKATVGTIYTVYNPIYKNNTASPGNFENVFKATVVPYLKFDGLKVVGDKMADGLAACSSDSTKFYFSATDGPAITTQMQALFASTLQNARLTQ